MSLSVSATAGLIALLAVAGLSVATPAFGTSGVTVTIPNGAGSSAAAAPGYSPAVITVVIGVNNTVTWTNDDTVAHTVIPKTEPTNGNWSTTESENLAFGQSYTFSFAVPGNYTYYCAYHAWMAGRVVVLAGAATTTSTTTSTTPEFPSALLGAILLVVILAALVAVSQLRTGGSTAPRLPAK
jgi:plastocyanin